MSKILIKNGLIYNGDGSKPYMANLLVNDGIIQEIGLICESDDYEVINADGCAVCPGFIDTHTHADLTIFNDQMHSSSLLQGVTTEIVGMCGLGFTPMNSEDFDNYQKYSAGIFGTISNYTPDFSTVGKYLDSIVCGNNIACAVTHSAIRIAGVGFQNIPLTGKPLNVAKDALRAAFEDGAIGFSTGLMYFPAYFSDTEELVELCRVAVEYDAPFLVHDRSVFANKLKPFNPTWEAMEVAKRTKIKLHLLHYKTTWPNTIGNIKKLFEPYYCEAEKEGVDISFELYPYTNGSGYAVVFIPYQYTEGGYYEIMKRLEDIRLDKRLEAELDAGVLALYDLIIDDGIGVFTHLKKDVDYVGRTFEYVANKLGLSVTRMIIKVLYDNDLEVGFRGTEGNNSEVNSILHNDMMELLKLPYYMVGSDSISIGEKPNPRTFGTFAKVLRMTREKDIPLETIINRMTKLPAERFALGNRGVLSSGKVADITIFDPLSITDTATWEIPRNAPIGIKYVLVNGKIAVRDEKPTGILAGRGIRRKKIV